MNILTKIIIIIVVVLIAVAIGAIAGVSSYMKSHRTQLDPGGGKVEQPAFAQKFDANIALIKWNVRTANLAIKPGSVFEVTIQNAAPDQFALSRNGHTLTIEQREAMQLQGENTLPTTITITVPKPFRIEATHLNGTITINDVTLKSIDLNHMNGTTLIQRVTIDDGIITKKNGATTLTDVTLPGLRVAIQNGDLTLNGETLTSDQLPYDDDHDSQLDVQSTNGSVKITTK